ncbi:MAG: type II secretion system protein [Kiritimatiellaeota bacterium]|nr:type II secretion system protein [Kiritimatiellota bacterium]
MNSLQKNGYTLIELLVVVATLAVLLTVTAKFVYFANKRCVAMTRLVTANQQRRLLTQAWRSFIGDCETNFLELNENGVPTSDGREASIEDGKLVLKTDGKTRKCDIPASMNAKITIESFDDLAGGKPTPAKSGDAVVAKNKSAKLAVIDFTPKRKQKGVLITNKIVRIVAVPRVDPSR